MADYRAPRDDMQFLLQDVFQVDQDWGRFPALSEVDMEMATAIIDEAAKLAETIIAPNARAADEEGVVFDNGVVTTPANYKENFQQLAAGGWVGVTANPDFGGMGLPKVVSAQYEEILCAADISFSLYPGLTAGAIITIDAYASDELKNLYLPRMTAGEWTGTMCLTEPHAGTDLGIIRTKAEPLDDGSFAVTGTKIFITGGEHDLTENIVHLVLAKLPDAPAGSKGISLFIVPKYLPDTDGNVGERNTVQCGSIEHKMGIHASATCVMNFDGAKGWLVGAPHQGLPAMFTMMNYERLGVGIQGLGAAARSYQNALEYAQERIQGRGAQANRNFDKEADPLIVHGDVRRMLLTMKAFVEGGRAFSTYVGQQLDTAKFSADAAEKARADKLVALLTPIAKAFITDTGFETTVVGQQVFGGHGYVREWGQEQLVRDCRIAQIYEGTNGIQALDLLGRKVAGSRGELLQPLVEDIQALLADPVAELEAEYEQLAQALKRADAVTKRVLAQVGDDENIINSVAVEYLHLLGYLIYGYLWLRMAKAALPLVAERPYLSSKVKTAKFFMARLLPRFESLAAAVDDGSQSLYLHELGEF
ncbi:acyl-CoA dehydrogenase C-terminal domain-containing protein [Pseudidiomarina terrestris]|uniref:Acyl-CoA dehydrogenase C-terminal domain-containing protein n=1 Tax=Pseudidiomarina terrestris TaxID=2820060 RepID=A0ABT8MK29_9GAMM|nr:MULTISPECIES: acyl-CoA dehydrogenase C-terminal domain-containing protein [unclassified Pseudidiomarina]MDN7130311.1 acyl-CoA dehydrogenase C-terminal domain-containing protein [Pseudidiomarina sp. 1APR75-15]MDN7136234.1 acyl-CoA dehydrogenase C-terminal domain-containing protein [Pseudidiomarina sp. 1ASP75-5]